MATDSDPLGLGVDSGNGPGNPLRTFRLAMLSHAFVEQESDGEWEPDPNQPMNYAILRPTRSPMIGTLIVGLVVIGLIVAAWVIA